MGWGARLARVGSDDGVGVATSRKWRECGLLHVDEDVCGSASFDMDGSRERRI
jgi:hypothetical protein